MGARHGIIKNYKRGRKENPAVKSRYRVTIEDILSDLDQTFASNTNAVYSILTISHGSNAAVNKSHQRLSATWTLHMCLHKDIKCAGVEFFPKSSVMLLQRQSLQ